MTRRSFAVQYVLVALKSEADTQQGVALLNLIFNRFDSWPVLTDVMQRIPNVNKAYHYLEKKSPDLAVSVCVCKEKTQFLVASVCTL